MFWFRKTLMILMAVAIVTTGFPAVAAKPPCPMAAKMHMQQMDMAGMQKDTPCKDCPKMAKQAPQKNKCCDDSICNVKCSALSGGVTAFFMPESSPLSTVKATESFVLADTSLSSSLSFSQDRPPKNLS